MNIEPSSIKNILIIKWGALGDMVASTPAIKAIRLNYPEAKIYLLTNKLMSQIVHAKSIVDELIINENIDDRGIKGIFALIKTILQLQRKRIDVVFNLRWTSDRCAVIARLCGAKYRVGAGPKGMMKFYNIPVNHPAGRYHEINRNLDFVKALGNKAEDTTPYIFISKEDSSFADSFFKLNNLDKDTSICIHPGASKPNRAWLPERYAEIAKRITTELNANIIITWGKNEREIANIVKDNNSNVIIAPMTKTVGQLAALISNCKMFISNCTGPMNVAVAVKTPVIALLGSSDPTDWGPYGDIHRIIKSPLQLEHYSDETERQAFESIDIEVVWNLVKERWIELKK